MREWGANAPFILWITSIMKNPNLIEIKKENLE
jgi:hypothetical protein